MSTTATTNVLITGAEKGIGKIFVEQFLQRPNHIVVAGLHETRRSQVQALRNLPTNESSKLVLVKMGANSSQDPCRAAQKLEAKGIDRLDVVVANSAGDGQPMDPADVYLSNACGPSLLHMALRPLLDRSDSPKWLSISSSAAGISASGNGDHYLQMFPYRLSKTALDRFTRTLDASDPKLVAFAVNPCFVGTDMVKDPVEIDGLEDTSLTEVEKVAHSILELLDNATKQNVSGRFFEADGSPISW